MEAGRVVGRLAGRDGGAGVEGAVTVEQDEIYESLTVAELRARVDGALDELEAIAQVLAIPVTSLIDGALHHRAQECSERGVSDG